MWPVAWPSICPLSPRLSFCSSVAAVGAVHVMRAVVAAPSTDRPTGALVGTSAAAIAAPAGTSAAAASAARRSARRAVGWGRVRLGTRVTVPRSRLLSGSCAAGRRVGGCRTRPTLPSGAAEGEEGRRPGRRPLKACVAVATARCSVCALRAQWWAGSGFAACGYLSSSAGAVDVVLSWSPQASLAPSWRLRRPRRGWPDRRRRGRPLPRAGGCPSSGRRRSRRR